MLAPKFEIKTYSDHALLINFHEEASQALTHYIYSLSQQVSKLQINGFIETVTAYQSLLVIFDVNFWHIKETSKKLEALIMAFQTQNILKPNIISVPVCYSPELAPDLENFCSNKNISIPELVAKHTAESYRVEMLGFLPGFLYLSGLSKELVMPRKKTPNFKVPAGSVAIGGEQTGIYPITSPGGWHIIGRTPMTFFDPDKNPPINIKPLDEINFHAITEKEYFEYGN